MSLREVTGGDQDFLLHLYGTTREDELAQVDWDEAQKRAFVRMQFEAQRAHYAAAFGDARGCFQVVEDSAGVPIGRLYLGRWEDEIRIIDIALVPERRGQGVGTRLIEGVMDEARQSGRPVRLNVEVFNPARALYARLGFVPVETKGIHVLMEWNNVS